MRRAIQWISEQAQHNAKVIETACIKFDLTPLEEAFLLRHFLDSGPDDTTQN